MMLLETVVSVSFTVAAPAIMPATTASVSVTAPAAAKLLVYEYLLCISLVPEDTVLSEVDSLPGRPLTPPATSMSPLTVALVNSTLLKPEMSPNLAELLPLAVTSVPPAA